MNQYAPSMAMRPWLLLIVLLVAGCASQPTNINDACTIFSENGGWFNNWYKATARVQKKYGVPKAIIMATLRQESAFRAHARPPRHYLLGIIPWARPSNAYGYAQALNSTWDTYRKSTGNTGADRDNFADAADFVGWYYAEAHRRNGIALTDAYHLYITYYLGVSSYTDGSWRKRADAQNIAHTVASTAYRYTQQMRRCGYKP